MTPAVAIQGEPGSNSHLAAEQRFPGGIELVPCRSFSDLFNAVRSGEAAYGMAPVENSLGGAVHQVWELLQRHSLSVLGELYFHVRHCLIAHRGVPLQPIRCVYSHEQALAQCRRYLQKLVWIDPEDIQPVYDTAGAVKMVKAKGKREEAAIASPQAAAYYDMQVLAEDIQTDDRNHTRFLVLGRTPEEAATGPQKTTLILDLGDCARPLSGVLQILQQAGIELLKLETCKRISHPWAYRIYLECAGAAGEEPLRTALPRIEALADELRLIGSYPLASVPD